MLLRYLVDPANGLTAIGLALAVLAVHLALAGETDLAVAAALWACLLDYYDGIVARHTTGRAAEMRQVGRHLDSLTDLAVECLFPAILLILTNDRSPVTLVIAVVFVVVGAARLSYYNAFGAPEGRYVGVPVTYAVPAVALAVLLQPAVDGAALGLVLQGTILVLIVLHLSRIRIPQTWPGMYATMTSFVVVGSAVLVGRRLL